MADLWQQRCFHHAYREAVARCPRCRRHFCRECITEHEGRVICSSCLRKELETPEKSNRVVAAAVMVLQLLAAVVGIWAVMYYFGRMLLSIPTSVYHGADPGGML